MTVDITNGMLETTGSKDPDSLFAWQRWIGWIRVGEGRGNSIKGVDNFGCFDIEEARNVGRISVGNTTNFDTIGRSAIRSRKGADTYTKVGAFQKIFLGTKMRR